MRVAGLPACLSARPPVCLPVGAVDGSVVEDDVHEVYDFTGPVLGTGAFATVLRVRDRMSGVEYAIKQVRITLTLLPPP